MGLRFLMDDNEIMLEKPEITMESIIEEFPGHLYWKDKNGIYLGANLEQARSLGFENSKALLNKSDYDFTWAAQANFLREIDLKVMQTGQPYILEEKVDTQESINRTYISKKAPLRDSDGHIIGVIGTSIDITHQKQIENALRDEKIRAEEASRVKSDFISNMSHDLRTPLSGIQSLAEDIIRKSNDKDICHDAELLFNASGELLNLIDGILNVIRLDASDIETTVRSFDLKRLMTNSIKILMPKIIEHEINFSFNYDENLPSTISGNDLFLQRIIMNLLSNAIKFTSLDGHIDLNVELLNKIENQTYIRFVVKDDGIGIPEDKVDYIFEKFNRLTASFRDSFKGAGIGLYMVKRYVALMNGDVFVKNNSDKGVSFIIDLPFSVSTESPVVMTCNNVNMEDVAGKYKGIRVLIVEDNIIAQRSQCAKFEWLGCSVELALNAKEALKKFKEYRFDLLVLDIGLPDMAGWALAQRFRNSEGNPNSLSPIIILTAHATSQEISEKNRTGLTAVLRKPLTQNDALRILEEYMII